MDQRKTQKLENTLKQIQSEKELKEYIDDPGTLVPYRDFGEYFKSFTSGKNLAEIIQNSGVERSYAYQILRGEKERPGRDKVIRLGIAAGMDLNQLTRALELSHNEIFYARRKRDIYLIYAVNHGFSVIETDLFLERNGEKPLE